MHKMGLIQNKTDYFEGVKGISDMKQLLIMENFPGLLACELPIDLCSLAISLAIPYLSFLPQLT